jgi:hypothetical protein
LTTFTDHRHERARGKLPGAARRACGTGCAVRVRYARDRRIAMDQLSREKGIDDTPRPAPTFCEMHRRNRKDKSSGGGIAPKPKCRDRGVYPRWPRGGRPVEPQFIHLSKTSAISVSGFARRAEARFPPIVIGLRRRRGHQSN